MNDLNIFVKYGKLDSIIIIDDTGDKERQVINNYCKKNSYIDITKNYNFITSHMILKKNI